MRLKKSAAPDGIPPELLNHDGQTVATHLHRIFVKIWIEEMIPTGMRNANIIPIFKRMIDTMSITTEG